MTWTARAHATSGADDRFPCCLACSARDSADVEQLHPDPTDTVQARDERPVDLGTDTELAVGEVYRNPAAAQFYEHGVVRWRMDRLSGALVAISGEKTGRSPRDKRIVEHPASAERRLVGAGQHQAARQLVRGRCASRRSTFSTRASGCTSSTASPAGIRKHRLKIRVICARPYHALFMHNMLIRPTRRGAGRLRRARLRDLQRRPGRGRSADARRDLDDQRQHRASSAARS